ncbi:hypothetical protein [Saccharomonospora sp. CUA-673]|uniref:hypothetical protein n=1 Tax=Saccharomonospora sp. CUA-673 TaxID=1904969 RepID=UPI00351202F0
MRNRGPVRSGPSPDMRRMSQSGTLSSERGNIRSSSEYACDGGARSHDGSSRSYSRL